MLRPNIPFRTPGVAALALVALPLTPSAARTQAEGRFRDEVAPSRGEVGGGLEGRPIRSRTSLAKFYVAPARGPQRGRRTGATSGARASPFGPRFVRG